MRIVSIYIFREDGIPLLSRFYDDSSRKVDGLVAPFLVGTTNRMEEITGSDIEEVMLAENTYLLMEKFAEIICAIVIRDKHDLAIDLHLVARRFYKRYHRNLSGSKWRGKVDTFEDFIPEMERLLGIDPEMVLEKIPSKVLDGFVMADFPAKFHPILKLLIKNQKLTPQELAAIELEEEDKQHLIEHLLEEEYIGVKRMRDDSKIFFVLS